LGYDAGSNPTPGASDPLTVLGSPERFTGEVDNFPSVVSPFSPPFGGDEIVSIGSGGFITVGFEQAIRDDADNSFGIDFLIFGNAGFIGFGEVGDPPAMFGVGGEATVQVSQNGLDWTTVETRALDLMPTLGYADSGPFDSFPGSIETDFTRPVDPSIALGDLAGKSLSQLVDLYDGSGGGVGFDLAGTGLSEISFIRVLNESDSAFEIDAFADVSVPSPGGVALLAPSGVFMLCRRRRRSASL
ncbi:MAG: hypothetical protein ACIARR_02600, partial [Phycisphaerales bacterium JB059]